MRSWESGKQLGWAEICYTVYDTGEPGMPAKVNRHPQPVRVTTVVGVAPTGHPVAIVNPA